MQEQYPVVEATQGTGISKGGLYNDEIESIMKHFKDFKGVIMRNEIKKLLPDIEPHSRIAFIINTDPSYKPGKHWCGVYIDARSGPESSNSIEWYDSYASNMPKDILDDCKLIIKCLKPESFLKLKENSIIHQSDKSSNCGYHCMKFLIDRFRGRSFAEATGYDEKMRYNNSKESEKEIERLKNQKPFSYIS